MPDTPSGSAAPGADPRAAFEKAQADMDRARAAAAAADLPHLEAALAVLAGKDVAEAVEAVEAARAALVDEPARQALWNIPAVVNSARRTLEATVARANAAIAAAPPEPAA